MNSDKQVVCRIKTIMELINSYSAHGMNTQTLSYRRPNVKIVVVEEALLYYWRPSLDQICSWSPQEGRTSSTLGQNC